MLADMVTDVAVARALAFMAVAKRSGGDGLASRHRLRSDLPLKWRVALLTRRCRSMAVMVIRATFHWNDTCVTRALCGFTKARPSSTQYHRPYRPLLAMKILRVAEQVSMPWKNGGGETIEIARSPEASSLDTFDWRISRARIESSGAFSRFPGIDRTLIVLGGEGILLAVEGCLQVRLTQQSKPFAFDGGRAAQSTLLQGPITDLNVMTKRGKFIHRAEPLPFGKLAQIWRWGWLNRLLRKR